MQCGLLEYILWLFGFNTCCQNSSHNTLLLILGFEERRHIMLNHLLTLSSISKCRKLHTELTIRVNYFISIFFKYKNLSNIFCRKKYYVLFFKIQDLCLPQLLKIMILPSSVNENILTIFGAEWRFMLIHYVL